MGDAAMGKKTVKRDRKAEAERRSHKKKEPPPAKVSRGAVAILLRAFGYPTIGERNPWSGPPAV